MPPTPAGQFQSDAQLVAIDKAGLPVVFLARSRFFRR